jgi:fructokinase
MSTRFPLIIFGEVLFDCFDDGRRVLGGAPFNVAWHLQALGQNPKFISRVGDDSLGQDIIQAMTSWKMDVSSIQIDPLHPTGQVEVLLVDGEPSYKIVENSAYDFIRAEDITLPSTPSLLYHGSLGLRNDVSRRALQRLADVEQVSVFLDVNLRPPWWHIDEVSQWLRQAKWVKLNEEELRLLGFTADDIRQAMSTCQQIYSIDLLIVTLGGQGALVRDEKGEFYSIKPEPLKLMVDTVGAGDAFTAMFIHGICSGWSLDVILTKAQALAAAVIGLRGATTTDVEFYQAFLD